MEWNPQSNTQNVNTHLPVTDPALELALQSKPQEHETFPVNAEPPSPFSLYPRKII